MSTHLSCVFQRKYADFLMTYVTKYVIKWKETQLYLWGFPILISIFPFCIFFKANNVNGGLLTSAWKVEGIYFSLFGEHNVPS